MVNRTLANVRDLALNAFLRYSAIPDSRRVPHPSAFFALGWDSTVPTLAGLAEHCLLATRPRPETTC
jgi:hypothetical protein